MLVIKKYLSIFFYICLFSFDAYAATSDKINVGVMAFWYPAKIALIVILAISLTMACLCFFHL